MDNTAGPSQSLLDRLEHAVQLSPPQPAATQAALEQLVAALSEQATSLQRGTDDLESTLFLDPFPYLLQLFPLLGSPTSSVTTLACKAVDLFASQSSGKELAMSLGERLNSLVPSDDDSNFGDESEEPDEVATSWDGKGAARELAQLVRVYSQVLPRIKALRPANFLSSAVEYTLGAMRALVASGTFALAGEDSDEGHVLAADVFAAVTSFIDTLIDDPWLEPARDLSFSLLQTLLLATAALLHAYIPASITQHYFIARYPRYRIPGRDEPAHPAVARAWESAVSTSTRLQLSPSTLYALSTTRDPSEPSQSIGAFLLLSHVLASSPNLRPSTLGSTSSDLISKTLRLLMTAFGAGDPGEGAKVGEDEALFWTWWCVQGATREGEDLDESILFTLVELLSAFSSLSPNSSSRFLAFRLLSKLVLQGTEKEEVQLMILKDLIEDCPFEQMRVASIGLLREVVAAKFELQERDQNKPPPPADYPLPTAEPYTSLFLSPLLPAELSNTLFRSDPPDLLTSTTTEDDLTADIFLESHAKGTMEKLSFLYFLLARDQSDLTTVRGTLPTTERLFLGPLRVALAAWLIQAEQRGDFGQVLELEIIKGGLERVDRAVGGGESL